MQTRTEIHEVKLTPAEMLDRGAEAMRELAALELAKETVKSHRDRLVELAKIQRTGKEMRSMQVYDEENLRTWEVETVDEATGRTVTSRKMTPEEIQGKKQTKIPGTDKAAPAPKERTYTAEEIHDKLAATIREACKKPKDRGWLDLHLAKGVPEATPEERKRAVTLHEEAARLAEQPDGKLLWIVAPPTEPAAPATH